MNAVEYAQELIRFDSTSHLSNGPVSDYVAEVLRNLGCETERLEYFDSADVLKVCVIARKGNGPGGVAYFGHTDVVPSGDWSIDEHGPFEPTLRDGLLYGRGSTDMKGSIACMLSALERVQHQELRCPVYISCTADEEIDHRGAIELTERSEIYQQLVSGGACGIVGEATSLDVVYAHKGGCQVVVTAQGKAAHSSTREGLNANLAMIPFLQDAKAIYDETELETSWMDNEFDPPTICLNLGVNDHNLAVNVTAPQSICTLLFRPMPTTNVQTLLNRIEESAQRWGLQFEIRGGNPAFRRDPELEFIQDCVKLTAGNAPRTVAYGSEASNFTDIKNLVVLGPGDIAQAHKSNEYISLDQLHQCEQLYAKLISRYCL